MALNQLSLKELMQIEMGIVISMCFEMLQFVVEHIAYFRSVTDYFVRSVVAAQDEITQCFG